jgi:hypothetical protein
MYGLTLPSHDDWYANSFLQEPHPRRRLQASAEAIAILTSRLSRKMDILFLINGQSVPEKEICLLRIETTPLENGVTALTHLYIPER